MNRNEFIYDVGKGQRIIRPEYYKIPAKSFLYSVSEDWPGAKGLHSVRFIETQKTGLVLINRLEYGGELLLSVPTSCFSEAPIMDFIPRERRFPFTIELRNRSDIDVDVVALLDLELLNV